MARKRNKYPLIEALEITDIAAEGKALGRYGDVVVFVPMTVPGDVVDVQITAKRRRFMEGYAVHYRTRSPLRCEPFCSHYGDCGGCRWQHLPYERQLAFKQQQVIDQLTRIGHIELPPISPILGSEQTRYYRNKLEFTACNKRWIPRRELEQDEEASFDNALGFHVSGMFDKSLDIERCHLQPEPSNALRLAVKNYAVEHEYPFYNIRTHEGFLRNIVIRTASTGDVMLIVVFAYEDTERRTALLEYLRTSFPELTSLMYIINGKMNDSYADLPVHLYSGRDYIIEQMEDLQFKVGPKSFYQTNSAQACKLYEVVREFASLSGSEMVYDLYTGTGTIANFVARGARKVVGIEYVPEAIEDAKANARLNGLDNLTFYAGDMKDVLCQRFMEENGFPDVIILDPPRAGLHEEVTATVLSAAPRRIVYVSCNPATQARDLSLMDQEYRVVKVQPVDMFPHTHHVENVVLLEKR